MSRPGTAAIQTPSRDSDEWVERVRSASDIVEIIGQTVALKRVGRNWVGLCPFHQEKTGSFSVNPERQFYHCFSCKAGGDVFRFVQETEKIGFRESVELLSRRAGIPIPERHSREGGARRPLLEALEAAAAAYEQWLADPVAGKVARDYLEQRGTTPETIREFRIGWSPPGWENLAQRLRGRFPEPLLMQAGLVSARDTGRGVYDRFRERLMVPLVAPGGDVLGFGARVMPGGGEPKYLNSPETPVYHKSAFLFGLEQARRAVTQAGEVTIVEGYFDVMAMHQAGVRATVATSGTALTPDHARLLQRLCPRVALTFDGDAAGQGAALRSLSVLLGAGVDVVVVELPEGQDPDTLVRSCGREAWELVRARACDPVAFIERRTRQEGQGGDWRERALQSVVVLAAAVTDPVRQGLLVERAHRVFGFPQSTLARAVSLRAAGQRSEAPVRAAVRSATRGHHEIERQMLQALLQVPEHLEVVRGHLDPEDFTDPDCIALAVALWQRAPAEGTALVLERELLASAPEGTDWTSVIEGNVRRLVQRRLEHERTDLKRRLTVVVDATEQKELLSEIQRITEVISEMHPRGVAGSR